MTTNDQYLKELGGRIRKARRTQRMSLQRLSQLCMADYSNLLAIERGKNNTKVLTLLMIAEKLNVDIKILI